MEYNKNITLIKRNFVTGIEKLKKNEWFVLMVIDEDKYSRPKKDYWNFELAYVGLERTSRGEIYISKEFNKRKDLLRGITMIAKVRDKSKCCILAY